MADLTLDGIHSSPCAGETVSEGGFAPGRVSVGALLGIQMEKDKKGKTYYSWEVLTRTGGCWDTGRVRACACMHVCVRACVRTCVCVCPICVQGMRTYLGRLPKGCVRTLPVQVHVPTSRILCGAQTMMPHAQCRGAQGVQTFSA